MPSCGIPICSPYKHYSVEESLGKSYGGKPQKLIIYI